MTTMQPLREEHQGLVPHIDALRTAGDAVGEVDLPTLRALVDDSEEFLTRHLIPHAEAEDAALYPEVQRVLGAPEATATTSTARSGRWPIRAAGSCWTCSTSVTAARSASSSPSWWPRPR